jgi:hypothetical protein
LEKATLVIADAETGSVAKTLSGNVGDWEHRR